MDKLGVFYTCFNENSAVYFSIQSLKLIYPNIKVYLVSDGGIDFNYLESIFTNIHTSVCKNTMGEALHYTSDNFTDPDKQVIIKNAIIYLVNRLKKAIDFCKSEYILMLDPDTYIRGLLNIPSDSELLGSRINTGFPQSINNILSTINSAIQIDCWGATPAIFKTKSFLHGSDILLNTPGLLDKFCKSFYAIFAHDIILPVIFALTGKSESFNPDIIECNRDPFWEEKSNPLVHQFKRYY